MGQEGARRASHAPVSKALRVGRSPCVGQLSDGMHLLPMKDEFGGRLSNIGGNCFLTHRIRHDLHDFFASNTAAVLAHLRATLDSSTIDRRMAGMGRATPLRAGELLLRLQPGMRAPSPRGSPLFDVAGVVAETALDAG